MTPIAQMSLGVHVSMTLHHKHMSYIHWLSMPTLVEYLRCHVAWCATGCGQHMKLLLVHDPTQSKVCNKKICVILWRSEEQILRFEITMHDAMIMEICDSG